MPSVRNYNPDSIIYFQDDKGDDIFVLQQGSVRLITNEPGKKEEKREHIKIGEFFGVKSSLGNYPKEETAQATSKSCVVVFTMQEFQDYLMNNARLTMKLLQVFSNDLRTMHLKVRSILNVEQEKNPAFELMHVSENFHQKEEFRHASYAYSCYLRYYPKGVNVNRAKELLRMAKIEQAYPKSYPAPEPENLFDRNSTKINASNALPAKQQENNTSGIDQNNISTLFSKAQLAMSNHEWPKAIDSLQECLAQTNFHEDSQKKTIECAKYEIGIAMSANNQWQEGDVHFSEYIKKYPTGDYIRHCIYQLGKSQERQKNTDRARTLYLKVATMQPHDSLTAMAREKIEKIK